MVFRKLASGGRVRALPQRLRRAGGACAPSRNGRVSPSTLAPTTHPEAVMRVFGPWGPIPLHRSRRLQGRRPYEPSARRDGGSVARLRGEAGKSGRETGGVLKGWGNLGRGFISVPFSPSSSSDLSGGSVHPGRLRSRAAPILGSSPRMTERESSSTQRTQRGRRPANRCVLCEAVVSVVIDRAQLWQDGKPANARANRHDRRLSENHQGERQVVVTAIAAGVSRQRKGNWRRTA